MQDQQGRWLPDLVPKGYEAFNDYHRFLLLEGPRKCVSEDTLLNTGHGLVRIGALGTSDGIINHPIAGFDGHKSVQSVATKLFFNQSKRAIKLTLANGKCLTVSPEHPLWCSAWLDEKPFFGYASAAMIADSVAKGVDISLPFLTPPMSERECPSVTIPVWKTKCDLCDKPHRASGLCVNHFSYYRNHNLQKPGSMAKESIRLTPDICYFLGAMCGDGSCRMISDNGTKRSIGFTNMDNECISIVKSVAESLGSVLKIHAKKSYQYYLQGDKTRQLLIAVGLTGLSPTKRIPEAVLNSTPSSLASFLSGLFDTDGTVGVKGSVSYSSTSELLARDVQDALSVFGIFSVLKPRITRCNGMKFPSWCLFVYGEDARQFASKIGFRIKRKQERVNSLPSVRKKFGYPNHIRSYVKKRSDTELRNANRVTRPRSWYRENRWSLIRDYVPTPEKLEKYINEFGTTPELKQYRISDRWVSVESATEASATLLDISVDGCNSFLAGGYINHNSGKSLSAVNRVARHLWENDGAVVGIIGKTLRNIKASGVWQDLTTSRWGIPQWENSGIGFKYVDEPKMTGDTKMTFFRVRNRYGGTSECQVHSLEHEHEVEAKFKGGRWSMIYLPEADQFKSRHTFDILEDQLRIIDIPYEEHQLIADCNPPPEGPDHWIHDIWFKQINPDSTPYKEKYASKFKRIHFGIDENPFLTEDDKDTLKQKYLHDKNQYARMVEGKWERDQAIGHFADFFIENMHIQGNTNSADEADWQILVPSKSCIEMLVGWDPGDVNHAASFIAPRDLGDQAAFDIIDEIVVLDGRVSLSDFTDMVTDQMDFWESIVKDRYGRDRIKWTHRADLSVTRYRSASDMEDALVVQAASDNRIVLRGVPKQRHSVARRISLCKRLFFDNRLFVSAQCRHHIDMFRFLRKGKNKSDIIEHKSKFKHIFDALTYALLEEVPEDIERRREPEVATKVISVEI